MKIQKPICILTLLLLICGSMAFAQEKCPTPAPTPDCSKIKVTVTCNAYPKKYWQDLGDYLSSGISDPHGPGNAFAPGLGGTCCEKHLYHGFISVKEFGGDTARTFQFTPTKSFYKRQWFEGKAPQCTLKEDTKQIDSGPSICIRVTANLLGVNYRPEPCDGPYGAIPPPRFEDTCEITVETGDVKADLCCAKPVQACVAALY